MESCEVCGVMFKLPKGAPVPLRMVCAGCMAGAGELAGGNRPPVAATREAPRPAPRSAPKDAATAPRARSRRPDATLKHAWMVIGGLLPILLVILWVLKANSDAEARERELWQAKLDGLQKELAAFDLSKPAAAAAAVHRAEETRSTWEGSSIDGAVRQIQNRAVLAVTESQVNARWLGSLEQLETAAKAPTPPTLDQFARLNGLISDLEADLRHAPPGCADRLQAAKATLDHGYITAMREDAQKAVAGSDGLAALALLARVEDAVASRQQAAKGRKDAINAAWLEKQLQEVAAESSTLAQKVLTPEVIERLPWRDLLGQGQEAAWRGSRSNGLEFALQGGEMHITNGEGKGVKSAVIVTGEHESWHDVVLDVELAVAKGTVRIMPRLEGAADAKKVPSVALGAAGDVVVTPESTCVAELRLIGDSLIARAGGTEKKVDVRNKSRRGGLGIVVSPGTDVTIKRLRMKVLR